MALPPTSGRKRNREVSQAPSRSGHVHRPAHAGVPRPILGTTLGLSPPPCVIYLPSSGHSFSIKTQVISPFLEINSLARTPSPPLSVSIPITAKLLKKEAPVVKLPSFSHPMASPQVLGPRAEPPQVATPFLLDTLSSLLPLLAASSFPGPRNTDVPGKASVHLPSSVSGLGQAGD